MSGKVPKSVKKCQDDFALWLLPFSLSVRLALQPKSEEVFAEIRVDFGGGPGNSRGSLGNFRGSLGNLRIRAEKQETKFLWPKMARLGPSF